MIDLDLDDVLTGLAAVLLVVAMITVWRFCAPGPVEAPPRRPGALRPALIAPVALIVLGCGLLAFIAEDVISRQPAELMLRLNEIAQHSVQRIEAQPGVRTGAVVVSHLTGEGLAVLVLFGVAWLSLSGRRHQAIVLVAGIVSAWALSGALKLIFAVPRPHVGTTHYAITRYGFPSGHALVVTVTAGLVAWLAGRRTAPGARLLLWTGATVIAVLTAAARVILHAHWLSDVIAGLSAGALWLGLVLLMAGIRRPLNPRSKRAWSSASPADQQIEVTRTAHPASSRISPR